MNLDIIIWYNNKNIYKVIYSFRLKKLTIKKNNKLLYHKFRVDSMEWIKFKTKVLKDGWK